MGKGRRNWSQITFVILVVLIVVSLLLQTCGPAL